MLRRSGVGPWFRLDPPQVWFLLPLLFPIGAVWGPMLDIAWLLPVLLMVVFGRSVLSRPLFANGVEGIRLYLWVWGVFAALVLIPSLAFGEFFKAREEVYRLVLPMLCAWFFASQIPKSTALSVGPWRPDFATCLVFALCGYLLAGFATVLAVPRDNLPSNAIPWAQGLGLVLAVLLPTAKAGFARFTWPLRIFLIASAPLGFAAIVLTESRGAFGAVLLPMLLLLHRNEPGKSSRGAPSKGLVGLALAVFGGIAVFAWFGVFDVAVGRLAVGYQEAVSVFSSASADSYNTSVGARVGLWQLGLREGLANLPWGVGIDRRYALVAEEGVRLQTPVISTLGHLHNQYLTDLLDFGLPGLFSGLVLLAGLVVLGLQLGGVAKIQLFGIALIHALGSLTNANFGHDFYSSILGTTLALVVLHHAMMRLAPQR